MTVQLYVGAMDADRNLLHPGIFPLTLEGPYGESVGTFRYTGDLPSDRSGQLGFSVRVVPSNADAVLPQELPLVLWE